ncbi:MAG: hypothetical protein ACE5NG_19360 [bacterium]
MPSYGKSFGPSALTADTKSQVGSDYTVPHSGVIKQIRYCFYQGVIDKATTGILYLESDRQKGPFEFAVGGSIGITTTSGATGPNAQTEVVEVDIPITQGEILSVHVKAAEALEEATISITWLS